jgi:nucleoside-diphosphate-sugar epimerase
VCAVSPTWEQIQVIHAEVVSRDAPAAQAALVRPSNSLASAEEYTRKLRSPTLAHAAEDSRKFIYISSSMVYGDFKDDVKEVATGYECGLDIAGFNDIQEGDLIEGYEMVEIKKKL